MRFAFPPDAAALSVPGDLPLSKTTAGMILASEVSGILGLSEIKIPYMHAFAVLLTATIDPGQYKPDLTRYDPAQRLSDYKQSLLFWEALNNSRLKGIVFCENSGTDLTPLADLTRKFRTPVEIISFEGNEKPSNMNYGYSELGIIDHAIGASIFLREYPYFIKATGRLTFPKISKLLDFGKIRF